MASQYKTRLWNISFRLIMLTLHSLSVKAEIYSDHDRIGLERNHTLDEMRNGLNLTLQVPDTEVELCFDENRCEKGWSENCGCDEVCHIYRDCCVDVKEPVNVSYTAMISMDILPYGTCQSVSARPETVFVVNRCPPNYSNNDTIQLCEHSAADGDDNDGDDDVFLRVPVSDNIYGVVFSNLYCALCQGWSRDQVTFWMAELSCDSYPQYDNNPLAAEFQYETILRDRHEYEYDYTMEGDLESSGLHMSTSNNNANIAPMSGSGSDSSDHTNLTVKEIMNQADTCSWVFNPPDGLHPRSCHANVISECKPEWEDAAIQRGCLEMPTGYVFDPQFTFRNIECAICNDNYLYSCNMIHMLMSEDDYDYRYVYAARDKSARVLSISVLLDFNNGKQTFNKPGTELKTVTALKSCSDGFVYDILTLSCRPLLCDSGYKLLHSECVLELSDISEYNISSETNMSHSSEQDKRNRNCPKIEIERTEYFTFPNGSIFINISDIVLDEGSYDLGENMTILICAEEFSQNYTLTYKMNYDIVQGIISLVGQIISVVALFILLLIYCTNSKLRTIPGKCLIALSLALFLAQCLFIGAMFVRPFPVVCQITAILIHFFYLASFFWMNIMAYDVWHTFHKQFIFSSNAIRQKKFIAYCCYCFIMPLVIVITAVVFGNTHMEGIYGGRICWITNGQALFYFFALPLFIILIVNTVLFVLAVCNIYKVASETEVLKNTKKPAAKRKRLILYIKLSSIMGLTWIFGFVASLTGYVALWYLFVIFNTLQGLFICLAFTCNRKVFMMLKDKADRYSEIFTSRSSVVTKRSTLESSL